MCMQRIFHRKTIRVLLTSSLESIGKPCSFLRYNLATSVELSKALMGVGSQLCDYKIMMSLKSMFNN